MSAVTEPTTPHEGSEPQTVESAAYGALVEHIRAGRCILFLGAGVHYPPPENSRFSYPEAERPPLGAALALQLAGPPPGGCNFASFCPEEPATNLQRVSLCYEKEVSRVELVSRIRDAVDTNARPSAAVRGLAELPFPYVITTNYDTLFERALGRADKQPFVASFEPDHRTRARDYPLGPYPSAERPFVFKVHGDINAPESIVVTDEDYISFVLRMGEGDTFHPIPQTLRAAFARQPTLFVGYRLLDYDLRLLFRTMRWGLDDAYRPDSYSVDLKPDPLIRKVWEGEHGFKFIAENVWDFVPRLYRDVLEREMPE